MNARQPAVRTSRLRPSAPHCRGGASSLLRLSSASATRWPSANALSEWAARPRFAAVPVDRLQVAAAQPAA